MPNRQSRISQEQYAQNIPVTKTASCTIKSYESVVEVDSSAGVAIALVMPHPAECIGCFITVYVTAFSGGITLTAATSQDFAAVTLNGVDDGVCLFSDGKRWWSFDART